MNNSNYISIVDYGSKNLRLSVFDKKLNNLCNLSKKIEKNYDYEEQLNAIDFLVKESEKKISNHLENFVLMLDDQEFISIDLSIRKDFDQKIIVKNISPSILMEASHLINNNYVKKKIIHTISIKYIINGQVFFDLKNNLEGKSIILEIKYLCLPLEKYNKIINIFKKKNLQIINFFCSSYVKSLSYIKSFKDYEFVAFLDIGFERSTLSLFNNGKLNFINFISIGGHHITKDISKVLNIEIDESEKIKKLFNKSEIEFSHDINNNHKNDSFLKKILDENISIDLLKKVVLARIEEIIELVFKDLYDAKNLRQSQNSIFVLTGNGSKLFNNNSFNLDDKYNFNEINFYEESDLEICNSGLNVKVESNVGEVKLNIKSTKKKGFFEKFFNFFAK